MKKYVEIFQQWEDLCKSTQCFSATTILFLIFLMEQIGYVQNRRGALSEKCFLLIAAFISVLKAQ